MTAKKHGIDTAVGHIYSWVSIGIVTAVCLLIIINVFYVGYGIISHEFLTTEPSASAMDAASGGILTPMIICFLRNR